MGSDPAQEARTFNQTLLNELNISNNIVSSVQINSRHYNINILNYPIKKHGSLPPNHISHQSCLNIHPITMVTWFIRSGVGQTKTSQFWIKLHYQDSVCTIFYFDNSHTETEILIYNITTIKTKWHQRTLLLHATYKVYCAQPLRAVFTHTGNLYRKQAGG